MFRPNRFMFCEPVEWGKKVENTSYLIILILKESKKFLFNNSLIGRGLLSCCSKSCCSTKLDILSISWYINLCLNKLIWTFISFKLFRPFYVTFENKNHLQNCLFCFFHFFFLFLIFLRTNILNGFPCIMSNSKQYPKITSISKFVQPQTGIKCFYFMQLNFYSW